MRSAKRCCVLGLLASALAVLNACGGSAGTEAASSGSSAPAVSLPAAGTADAVRLAHQASFGPDETLVDDIRRQGAAAWVASQLSTSGSSYRLGGTDAVHRQTTDVGFCDQARNAGPNCWRDNFASDPLLWDFYRNALQQPDQLRQRMAFALQQIVVVSGREVFGTYGLRNYHNRLLDLSFGSYREVLRAVALSPVMGDYLNNVNNHRKAPNENFARELLQLFSIGSCELTAEGALAGGACRATYNNETVRAYAYALTGWTYPDGGSSPWGCWPSGTHCRYYGGNMEPLAAFHDTQARSLLSGVGVPAGSTAELALERVLDSLMLHPNMAPFISRQLIQHLVSSNPSGAYVQRVSRAFVAGQFSAGDHSFGSGQRGDLAATVAAILLDDEARNVAPPRGGGRLREPALLFTGVLRALNGHTDGHALNWWWGESLGQRLFSPPSVFNFYPPDYPVAGTALVGPAFGIHNSNTGVGRLNFLSYLLLNNGSGPEAGVPGAVGTGVKLTAFEPDANDPARLVDRLSALAYGELLPANSRQTVIDAVTRIDTGNTRAPTLASDRVKQAAYLIFAAPQWHVLR